MSARSRLLAMSTAVAVLALSFGSPVIARSAGAPKHVGPVAASGTAASFHVSRPARDIARDPRRATRSGTPQPRHNPLANTPDHGARGTWGRGSVPADPLSGRTGTRSVAPPPVKSWDGTGNPVACSGCLPPDTTGDVSATHYIQVVNATKVAIYTKSGALATPLFDLGDLWPVSDVCNTNDGDPNVNYDQLANRWVLSQFNVATNELCFAVSKTAGPTGAYWLFSFVTGTDFPDYFKVGIGPDAYYVGANESTYTAYAFDRAKMLVGDGTAGFIKFAGQTNFLMPADLDGPNATFGTAGYFYTFKDNTVHGGVDRIELFKLDPDFVTPANSTFLGPTSVPIAAFTYTPCGFFIFDCVNQLGATADARIDAIGEWPMQRLVYRNFGGHETLLGTFTIGTAPNGPGGTGEVGAAPRWFELRKVGAGAWTLFQEGTYDPADGHDRFMGSIAMDGNGNIALGYSVSSSAIHPAIRYATRAPGDPPGTLGAEQALINGAGTQTSSESRWGDYSSMTIDPADDCTFWYTNEYYAANSLSTWSTRIGAFRPACTIRKPDGRVRVGTGPFVGNNVYNTTGVGQKVTGTAAPGVTITYTVSIQNDGTVTDGFTVAASGAAVIGYDVTYFKGALDITAAVVAGTYTTASIAVGGQQGIKVKIKVKAAAAAGSKVSRLLTITSVGDTSRKDAVKVVGKRA